MSAILGSSVTGAGGGAYTIDNSLRFRSSASANLQRTFTSAGNRTTWTFSVWLKKCGQAVGMEIFGSDYGDPYANPYNHFGFQSSPADALNSDCGPEGTRVQANTSAIYRDPSAWYHVVCAFDTTQTTAANRIKYYVNGVQQTMTGNFPAQNYQGLVNSAGLHSIGVRLRDNANYFNGYMAEFYFIDGQALTASSFGETNASTGVWQPKAYSGSYGTNGFYLKFSDVATTSGSNAGLGKDFSGNGNYWNTNNISVTSGVTYDAMTDSPTPKSSTVGNFCTLNPLDKGNSNMAASNANLTFLKSGAGFAPMRGTLSVTSGKYYFEMTANTSALTNIGVCNDYNIYQNGGDSSIAYPGGIGAAWDSRGYLYRTGGSDSYAYTFTTNDVVMVAFDASSGKIWFGKNGTWNASGDPAAGTNAAYTAASYNYLTPYANGESGGGGSVNFGQRPFVYTPPSGFNRLETYNLPTPTVGASSTTLANKYFDATTYTGNGSSQTVSNSGSMQPSFVWLKSRSNAYHHYLVDVLRGQNYYLRSSSTNGQNLNVALSFASTGFGLNSTSDAEAINANGATYVGWQWNSPSSGSTNTSGSVTSTVSANTTAGFSIVTVTAPNGGTVGHGLGVAPDMMIAKRTDTTSNWMVQQRATGVGYTILQSSQGYAGGDPSVWNGQFPSSSVIYTASGGYFASGNFVIYCFAEKAGFSKFGKYTGNNSSDGPFIYCGFRPRFIMVKRTDAASDWFMYDTARSTYNVGNQTLTANTTTAEGSYASTNYFDFLSNGFKIRQDNNNGYNNASGGTYQYMAFAENPFNYSLAR